MPFHVGKETTALTGPVGADGLVDYVAAMNERYGKGVSAEENGFVAWVGVKGIRNVPKERKEKILALAGAGKDADAGAAWQTYLDYLQKQGASWQETDGANDAIEKMRKRVWKAEENPRLAAYLTAEAGAFDRAALVAGKGKWWVPVVSPDGTLGSGTLWQSGVMDFARAWCARATLRAGSGDMAGFVKDVVAVKKLARLVGTSGMELDRLGACQTEEVVDQAIGAVAGSGMMTAEEAAGLRKQVAALGEMPGMEEVVDGELRWVLLDYVERMLLARPNTLGKASAFVVAFHTVEWGQVDGDTVLRLANGVVDDLVKGFEDKTLDGAEERIHAVDARVHGWEKAREAKNGGMLWKEQGETEAAYSERVGRAMVAFFLPETDGFARWEWQGRMEGRMADVMLRAAEIKAQTGKWPGSLAAIGATEEQTRDDFVMGRAAPWKYVVGNHGVKVYSVGKNGKDDGGVWDTAKGEDDLVVGR